MIQFTFSISITLLMLKQNLLIWMLFKEVKSQKNMKVQLSPWSGPVLYVRGSEEGVYVFACVQACVGIKGALQWMWAGREILAHGCCNGEVQSKEVFQSKNLSGLRIEMIISTVEKGVDIKYLAFDFSAGRVVVKMGHDHLVICRFLEEKYITYM